MRRGTAILLSTLGVTACVSLDPTYHRPASPAPTTWPSGPAYAALQPNSTNAADIPWRDFVKDQKLREVVDQALRNSRNLREAITSIESARAQYRVQRANLFPQISASVEVDKSRTLNPYAGTGATGGGGSSGSSSGSALTTTSDTAQVGLSSYEIDLFGRNRSLTRAAYESYLSTAEAARATHISLIAETITAYLTLAADQTTMGISQRTLQNALRSMQVTGSRLAAGVASLVDVKQAETTYQQARSDVASLTANIAQDRNALELLVGSPIDEALLPAELPEKGEWLADIPAGISSDVLLNRPDVLQAEHTLKSANADIGAARAAFFPSFSLTASDGRASSSLSKLFSGPAVWSWAPSLSLPLFTGGANSASLANTKAQRDGYVAAYELAIQTAFKEVADALAVRARSKSSSTLKRHSWMPPRKATDSPMPVTPRAQTPFSTP
jgi:multidrug efflux system outer membrane protein